MLEGAADIVESMLLAKKFLPILNLSQVCRQYRDVTFGILSKICPQEYKLIRNRQREKFNPGLDTLLRKLMVLEQMHACFSMNPTEPGTRTDLNRFNKVPGIEPELFETPLAKIYLFLAHLRVFVSRNATYFDFGKDIDYPEAVRRPCDHIAPTLDAWHRNFFYNALRVILAAFREAHMVGLIQALSAQFSSIQNNIKEILQSGDLDQWALSLDTKANEFHNRIKTCGEEMTKLTEKWQIASSALKEPFPIMHPHAEQIVIALSAWVQGVQMLHATFEKYKIPVPASVHDIRLVDVLLKYIELPGKIYNTLGTPTFAGRPLAITISKASSTTA